MITKAAQPNLVEADIDVRPAAHRRAGRPVGAHACIRDIFEPNVGRVADHEVSCLNSALSKQVIALPSPCVEGSGTAGRFHDEHVGEIAIGHVSGQVENYLDHSAAGEYFAMLDGLLQSLR